MVFFTIILSVCFLLFASGDALAWGPATHLDLGWTVINNSTALAAPVRALIDQFPYDFLYGNISADIVVAKNLMREHIHCHNWRVGLKVLEKAETQSQRAFAYGYLSHLAADTVAHNEFIPEMIVRSFSTTIHRHIYWELRFDSLVDRKIWGLPERIAKQVHTDNDILLNANIKGTPLPFKTNKRIFSSVLNLHKVERWHKMIDLLSKRSKWAFHQEDKDKWFGLALERVEGFLTELESAPCMELDPTGKKNLKKAALDRKRLRRLKKSGKDYNAVLEESVAGFSI